MNPTAVTIWADMAAFVTVIDVVVYYRRITGKMGEHVRAHYWSAVHRTPGGLYTLAACALFLDIALPPIALGICLFAWSRDWRWYQEELKAR